MAQGIDALAHKRMRHVAGAVRTPAPAGHRAVSRPRSVTGSPTYPGVLSNYCRFNSSGYVTTCGIEARNLTTGASQVVVQSADYFFGEPTLSPDGSTVAFVETPCEISGTLAPCATTNTYGNDEVAYVPFSGGPAGQVLLSSKTDYVDYPSWSPDSTTVMVSKFTFTSTGIVTASTLVDVVVSTTSATTVTITGETTPWDGVFSPDGKTIAYLAGGTVLKTVPVPGTAGGGTPVAATHDFTNASAIAWSPDGTKLAVDDATPPVGTGDWHQFVEVVRLNATSPGLSTVTALAGTTIDGSVYAPAFSTDGSEVLYGTCPTVKINGNYYCYPDSVDAVDVSGTYRTTVLAGKSDVANYVGGDTFGPAPVAGVGSTFTALTPTRLATLTGTTAVTVGHPVTLPIAGVAGIPTNVTAVTLNLTGSGASVPTYVQVYPGGSAPLVSNLNLMPNQVAAVAVQVPVSSGGTIVIATGAGRVGVRVDVSGYFQAGSGGARYQPLPGPVRVLPSTPVGPGLSHQVTLTGVAGEPANAVAAVVNVTGTVTSGGGTYLTAYPDGVSLPGASTLNLAPGAPRANLATVGLGADGDISVYNAVGTTNVIVDVMGIYTTSGKGLQYVPVTPTRVLDTRNGTNTRLGSTAPLGAAATLDLPVVGTVSTAQGQVSLPSTAAVAVFTLTAVDPSTLTYLTAFPTPTSGSAVPATSSLNAQRGQVTPNLSITAMGAGGRVRIYNSRGTVPTLVDLSGYYQPPAP